ncbi:MAG: helix-turn-helix domain-containing protein [Acidiferrobacter sp.]
MRQIIAMERSNMAISQDEREFFVALGNRIAQRRKDSHLTQAQLAATLGVSQPTMNAYELGQRRVPVSALTVLAKTLCAGLEELLGESMTTTRKHGASLQLQRSIDRINELPKLKQRFVIEMLETVLAQASR